MILICVHHSSSSPTWPSAWHIFSRNPIWTAPKMNYRWASHSPTHSDRRSWIPQLWSSGRRKLIAEGWSGRMSVNSFRLPYVKIRWRQVLGLMGLRPSISKSSPPPPQFQTQPTMGGLGASLGHHKILGLSPSSLTSLKPSLGEGINLW